MGAYVCTCHIRCEAHPDDPAAEELEAAIREHAGVVVAEMEAYYRDGRHPDLRPVLRAGRALLELTGGTD